MDSKIKVADVVVQTVNGSSRLTKFSDLNLNDKLSDLSCQMLESGLLLKSEDRLKTRATDRAVSSTPPAKKGSAVKDCIIYEHCLDLFRRLRQEDFGKACIFLTSNTKDYCDGGKIYPKEPIIGELGELFVNFATRWEILYSNIVKTAPIQELM